MANVQVQPVAKVTTEVDFDLQTGILADLESVREFFREKIDVHNRNYDFYKGKQWTEDEVEKHNEQNRHAFVFNEIHHKVDHLRGTEMQTRLDTRIVPRETGDEAMAETLTYIVKWAEQANDIDAVQSEVFQDQLIGGAGAAVIRWECEDLEYGYPKIETVPIDELRWDVTAKKQDLSDARWMARVCIKTRQDWLEMFPEYSKVINDVAAYAHTGHSYELAMNMNDHQELVLLSSANRRAKHARDLVEGIEYYERIKIYQYVVVDEIQNRIMAFDQYDDAADYYDGLMWEYSQLNESHLNPDGTERVSILTTYVNKLRQYFLFGRQLASNGQMTNLEHFPWVIAFAGWDKGDYWTPINNHIDPQMLVNRFFSQWDYQLAMAPKIIVSVMKSLLHKGYTIADLEQELSKTISVLPVYQHAAVEFKQPPQMQPELLQGVGFAIDRMNDYIGGRNVLGLQENAAESGRAVIARAEQGGVSKFPVFENLRVWRHGVTIRLVWLLKNYMPSGQVLRIIGADNEVQFLSLDDGVLETMREIKVDIEIDEALKSENAKERNFQTLKELFHVVQIPMEIAVPIMIEYSALPKSKKREILQMMNFYKVYMQQQAEMKKSEKMEQEVVDSLKKKALKESMTLADQLKEVQGELKTRTQNINTKLEDIEKARLEMEMGNVTPSQKNAMFASLNNPEEIRQRQSASLQSL